MESKYYTPSLEEFHVGFEFETSYLEDYDTWKKVILEFDDFGFYTSTWEVDSNPTEFRVKFLDQEDIESLGWRFEKQHAGTEELQFTMDFKNPSDDLGLDYDLESHYLRISWYGNGDVTRFSGRVKNKSELKRLLKQLSING